MLILMRPKVHKNLKRSSMKFLVQVAVAFKQKGLRILLGSIFHQISFLKFYSFFRSILIGVFFFFFFLSIRFVSFICFSTFFFDWRIFFSENQFNLDAQGCIIDYLYQK